MVNYGKELIEKLGRNDLCPCHSGRRFQELLSGLLADMMGPTEITSFRE
ncbi:MAG: SEC-C domain-containing protein [Nitrospira sp.]|nr:SEC-C domain-containing protein [Nitrospira sp.]